MKVVSSMKESDVLTINVAGIGEDTVVHFHGLTEEEVKIWSASESVLKSLERMWWLNGDYVLVMHKAN